MAKISRSILVLLFCCLHYSPAVACRYNVRDIGFADLGSNSYYLFGYFSEDSSEQLIADFKEVVSPALLDSNVKSEAINVEEQKDHPGVKYFNLHKLKSLPAAILVSSDDRSMVIGIGKDKPFKQALRDAVNTVVSSPKRSEIIDQAIENYG